MPSSAKMARNDASGNRGRRPPTHLTCAGRRCRRASCEAATFTYNAVVLMLRCPRRSATSLIGLRCPTSRVAKLWRRRCAPARPPEFKLSKISTGIVAPIVSIAFRTSSHPRLGGKCAKRQWGVLGTTRARSRLWWPAQCKNRRNIGMWEVAVERVPEVTDSDSRRSTAGRTFSAVNASSFAPGW